MKAVTVYLGRQGDDLFGANGYTEFATLTAFLVKQNPDH
jgi:hypothetical protein